MKKINLYKLYWNQFALGFRIFFQLEMKLVVDIINTKSVEQT